MKKILLIFVLILISCSDTQEDSTEIIKPIESSTTIPTTTTSTTTTTLGTTTTTNIKDFLSEVSITCEPDSSSDEEYLTFKFEVKTGTNELTVLNIVSWFDSTRTDDLFFYDNLPEPGNTKEFGYSVDSSFSKYEIEILIMDSKENFANDYCLYEK